MTETSTLEQARQRASPYRGVNTMVSIELLVQQVVNGLLFGGQLALMAVGLTLIWGVARVLNFGHGAMFMVGGFVGYFTPSVRPET